MTDNIDTDALRGCVLMVLSTFRNSRKAMEVALTKCTGNKKLLITYIIDMNKAKRIIKTIEKRRLPVLKGISEEEWVRANENVGREQLKKMAKQAEKEGINVITLVPKGQFGVICLELIKKITPSFVITTRGDRSTWDFFGSPELIAQAACPIMVVEESMSTVWPYLQ